MIARALKAVGRSGEVEQFRFTGNNQALASRLLTIHRSTLRKKLEDLGLRE
ncbi:MAG TPA: helix-turn-helix domain-containing protein [Planctomycetota bacterium]|nr:helix-turn-helix domain-containing protein [Planctomycetota bacterium]